MCNLVNDDEVQSVIKQFHVIARKKWIKSVNKGLGSIGYTFERELGKNPDSLYFPDYYGTEIKCTSRYSRYPVTLFTAAFDGPSFPEINRIVDKYGYFDKDIPGKKVLFSKVSCLDKTLIASGYQIKLDVDFAEEKLYLFVYGLDGTIVERLSFIYFKTLYDRLNLKLNRLALVFASKKVDDGVVYFRYYKICVYKLKKFEVFIDLLVSGVLQVSLIARVSKSGVDLGRYRNKNLVFMLKKCDFNKLFDEIYSYDYDGKVY